MAKLPNRTIAKRREPIQAKLTALVGTMPELDPATGQMKPGVEGKIRKAELRLNSLFQRADLHRRSLAELDMQAKLATAMNISEADLPDTESELLTDDD